MPSTGDGTSAAEARASSTVWRSWARSYIRPLFGPLAPRCLAATRLIEATPPRPRGYLSAGETPRGAQSVTEPQNCSRRA
jgi:hypothetical protein